MNITIALFGLVPVVIVAGWVAFYHWRMRRLDRGSRGERAFNHPQYQWNLYRPLCRWHR
jgi:hypothetical protein